MTITGTTCDYEPMRKNRYIFEFPKEIEIPMYCVQKVSNLTFNIDQGWDDLVVSIIPIPKENILKKLVDYINNLENRRAVTFQLKNLDPTGVELQTFSITGLPCAIDFDDLDYASDKLSKIKLYIKVYQVIVL